MISRHGRDARQLISADGLPAPTFLSRDEAWLGLVETHITHADSRA